MEGRYHLAAKKRVVDLLVRLASPLGYEFELERQFSRYNPDVGITFDYSFDLVVFHVVCRKCGFEDERICVEFDTPGAGHGTRISNPQDALKDRTAEAEGYKVVRLNTYYLTGFRGHIKGVRGRVKVTPSPDEDILAELALTRLKPIQA